MCAHAPRQVVCQALCRAWLARLRLRRLRPAAATQLADSRANLATGPAAGPAKQLFADATGFFEVPSLPLRTFSGRRHTPTVRCFVNVSLSRPALSIASLPSSEVLTMVIDSLSIFGFLIGRGFRPGP
jgi:hypothetical protein